MGVKCVMCIEEELQIHVRHPKLVVVLFRCRNILFRNSTVKEFSPDAIIVSLAPLSCKVQRYDQTFTRSLAALDICNPLYIRLCFPLWFHGLQI